MLIPVPYDIEPCWCEGRESGKWLFCIFGNKQSRTLWWG